MKSAKYVNTLLEVLEYLEEKGELYSVGGLSDVETGKQISQDDVQNRIVLTGSFIGGD